MDRGMTGAMITELQKESCTLCHLLTIELDAETVYLTDAAVNLSWNGQTYLASHFLSFSDINETTELVRNSCTVVLSGVDQAVTALLLIYEYAGRKASIRKAALDANLTVIASPCLIISGRIDKPVIATDPESGTCTASIEIVSRFSPLFTRRALYTNDEVQQSRYPGDKGFEHVHEEDEVIIWGSQGHRVRLGPVIRERHGKRP